MADLRLVPTTAELLAAPALALELGPTEAAALLASVEGLAAILRLAATQAPVSSSERPSPQPGRWLTPDEAASIASVHRRVVYSWSRRADWRGFTRRLSRKVLRVEELGFRRWLDLQSAR